MPSRTKPGRRGGGESERRKKNGRGGGGRTPAENRAGVVDGFHVFVVWSGSALRGLTVVCLEKNVGMFVDACVNEVGFSETADFIHKVIEMVVLERE